MADLNRPPLTTAFRTVQRRMTALLEFANAATSVVQGNIELIDELSDSVIVLAVSRLEAFFIDVVSLGTRHREAVLRRHFAKHGHASARTCDLPALVTLVRRRFTFEHDGKRLDNLFQLIFRCSVWPTDDARARVLDLVLLRHFIVHSNGQDWSQDGAVVAAYANQFRVADVLEVVRLGKFATYSGNPYKALLFCREALLGVVEMLKYLEQRIVRDQSWARA
jgi:hypothetical protein